MAVVADRIARRGPERITTTDEVVDRRATRMLLGMVLSACSPSTLEVAVNRCQRSLATWALPGFGHPIHEQVEHFLAGRG